MEKRAQPDGITEPSTIRTAKELCDLNGAPGYGRPIETTTNKKGETMTPTEFRKIRELLGFTQAEFAKKLGLAHGARVQEKEAGKFAVTTRDEIIITGLLFDKFHSDLLMHGHIKRDFKKGILFSEFETAIDNWKEHDYDSIFDNWNQFIEWCAENWTAK